MEIAKSRTPQFARPFDEICHILALGILRLHGAGARADDVGRAAENPPLDFPVARERSCRCSQQERR